MCSLHLTHPSADTPGTVGSRRCGAQGAVLKGLTSVLDNSSRSRDSNPQPRVTSSTRYPLGHDCPLESLPVPPRFELRSLDSKSRVLTITPWNLHSMIEDRGNVIALSCVSNQASCRVCLFINDAVFLNQQIPPDVTVFLYLTVATSYLISVI